jgi:redox-sensitive bicupin YhaK (pirin superfamily)
MQNGVDLAALYFHTNFAKQTDPNYHVHEKRCHGRLPVDAIPARRGKAESEFQALSSINPGQVSNVLQAIVHNAEEIEEGAGVMVQRLMPVVALPNFDPFVLMDHFRINPDKGFPDHPHRGFEAITYLFSGSINHKDNLGNDATVSAGGAQRFTAGSGIVHSEMPATDEVSSGIQLWINLPQRLKKLSPSYQQVDSGNLPELAFDGGRMRVIVDGNAAIELNTPARLLEVELDANGHYQDHIEENYRGFVYVAEGAVELNGLQVSQGQAAFFESGDQELKIYSRQGCHCLLSFGQPHGEPIHQHGSFVD